MLFTMDDVFDLCKKYYPNPGIILNKSWKRLESLIKPDEELLSAVTGVVLTRSSGIGGSEVLGDVIVVITNKRILYAGNTGLFTRRPASGAISIENVSSVTSSKPFNSYTCDISIETIGNDDIKLSGVQKNVVDSMTADLSTAIDIAKEKKNTTQTTVIQQVSSADEILKFKQLLDAGIITQEDFDNKKKQLLGL